MERNIKSLELTLKAGVMERYNTGTYHLFFDGQWHRADTDLENIENHKEYSEDSLIGFQINGE